MDFASAEVTQEKLIDKTFELIKLCMEETDLQNEVLLQLIKQTVFQEEPGCFAVWRLLSLCMGVFLPTGRAFSYVRICFIKASQEHRDSIIGHYATYALHLLEQGIQRGTHVYDATKEIIMVRRRKYLPSRLEIGSIISVRSV
jgi:hypothetical protein